MKTLEVNLGQRTYPIYVGRALIGKPDLLDPHLSGNQVMVVSNDTVAPIYLPALRAALTDFDVREISLPDGESHKNLATCSTIFDARLEHRFDRGCTLIALGGGVVGDITGFTSACYQRGVNFIQIPTTLLAQVDSSVGGKTGVNHRLGKNMIGAFHQPRCVAADTDTLDTLPDRELRAGFAEVIKYGLIRDLEFLEWLEENAQALMGRDPTSLAFAIERSCRNKAEIVAEDEKEAGVRALLNLGHTFGHAIETGCGYGMLLHGEAVALGIRMAAEMSARLGLIQENDQHRVNSILDRFELPGSVPKEMTTHRFLDLMAVDKKVRNGRLRLVLLRGLGHGIITSAFSDRILHDTLKNATSG